MAKSRKERIEAVIAGLNALAVGELSAIETKLLIATEEVAALAADDLEKTLKEAGSALAKGDVSNFRRLVS